MSTRFVAICDSNGNWYVTDTYQEVPLLPFANREIAIIIRDDFHSQTKDILDNLTELEDDNAED